MSKPAPVIEHMQELRVLLDEHRGYEILNNPRLRAAMRDFVKGTGAEYGGNRNVTRPDIATQAFCFAVELERERTRSLIANGTWPCHDHPPPDATIQELFALAQRADG